MAVIVLKRPPEGVPKKIEVDSEAKVGGEGSVYFSRDNRFAIKVYHQPSAEREQMLKHVMTLFSNLPPDQEQFILPPLALVQSFNGRACTGFVMRRVPPEQRELVHFILDPKCAAKQFRQGRTWADYLKVARSVANAITVLHGKGCAHGDIHYRNFLVNIEKGEAVMLDIDSVVVAGFLPPQVKGMMGFMAPEILTQHASPNERTDRHSLAVLVLHTLLFRNVMMPLREYCDGDPDRSEELGWGENALFSEHPDDRRHRPKALGLPLYRQGQLSYRMLTPLLQKLTEQALIDGLRKPDKRPLSREWEEALACAMDELWMCSHCRQYFPYPCWLYPRERRTCPFCGTRCQPPYPAVLQLYEEKGKHKFAPIDRKVVLGSGFRLFADATQRGRKPPVTRKAEPVVGHVEWDETRKQYRLVNDEDCRWTALSPDEKRLVVMPGQSVLLLRGFLIHFGEGKRLAQVVEDAGSLG